MQIKVEQKGDVTIIKYLGNIDSDAYGVFKQTFEILIANNNFKIVVDLSDVSFISSAGWGVFIGNLQKIRKNGGDIRLAEMREEVKNIYLTVNFNELLKSYDTLNEAIESFG
ncbi:MAG: STAS domain-containing protein [Candidatus Goldbacteria bacterium]|nr:STAS domain-containing protein [Candidatus Goldiibacteriota bacterium]